MTIIPPVVCGLVWALSGYVKVLGLHRCECGQLDIQLFKVGTSNFLVELLWQYVHADRKLAGVRKQGNLGQDLIAERARHHKRRMSSRTTITIVSMGHLQPVVVTYPKLTRRPSARRRIWRPDGIVNRST